jgi:RNA polymerase sigma-70 factor (ECF subfamily)
MQLRSRLAESPRSDSDDVPTRTPLPADPDNVVPISGVRRRSEPSPARGGGCTDAELVRRALLGQPRAASEIWDRYAVLVRSLLRRTLGSQDVDDLAQEVFLRLFPALPQLRDPNALRSFLIGITLRVTGTELRRRRFRWWLRLTPDGDLDLHAAPGRDDAESSEALAHLYAILDKLGTHARMVFVLRHIEEMELAQVADTLGISLATTKRHLFRATARVHAMVERDPALAAYVRRSSHASM